MAAYFPGSYFNLRIFLRALTPIEWGFISTRWQHRFWVKASSFHIHKKISARAKRFSFFPGRAQQPRANWMDGSHEKKIGWRWNRSNNLSVVRQPHKTTIIVNLLCKWKSLEWSLTNPRDAPISVLVSEDLQKCKSLMSWRQGSMKLRRWNHVSVDGSICLLLCQSFRISKI